MDDRDNFIGLVRRLRAAQKAYFKDRKQSDLIESKKLEKEVDQALDVIANETPEESEYHNLHMFPEEL